METLTELKPLIDNPHYQDQRRGYLTKLNIEELDFPIRKIIGDFCNLPFCFTLQSCYGHFLYDGQKNTHNIEPLPQTDEIETVEYRIAYITFCVENSKPGIDFLGKLKQIPKIDREYIQFGCAEWFWKKNENSYVLQAEPTRHMKKDKCLVEYQEALHLEKVRNKFYDNLTMLVSRISKHIKIGKHSQPIPGTNGVSGNKRK